LITDVTQQQKYAPHYKRSLAYWAMFHFVSILGLLLLLLYHFGDFAAFDTLAIGLALFAAIFGYTSVMDLYKWSVAFEWSRIAVTFIVLQWAMVTIIPTIYWAWMGYLMISVVGLVNVFGRGRMLMQTES
jgi:hypothetical protein